MPSSLTLPFTAPPPDALVLAFLRRAVAILHPGFLVVAARQRVEPSTVLDDGPGTTHSSGFVEGDGAGRIRMEETESYGEEMMTAVDHHLHQEYIVEGLPDGVTLRVNLGWTELIGRPNPGRAECVATGRGAKQVLADFQVTFTSSPAVPA